MKEAPCFAFGSGQAGPSMCTGCVLYQFLGVSNPTENVRFARSVVCWFSVVKI
ncbi:hypothetical protein AALP_AA6G289200 [Arabis alpina]|uniref:Uncharacterized protein n=1 Tax=Arabis alpina TaxID=50452 RepID=A0A087GSE2_ARAAL|nr:hypothetical protein AALP_AA6G289200 [Arabis alpina]